MALPVPNETVFLREIQTFYEKHERNNYMLLEYIETRYILPAWAFIGSLCHYAAALGYLDVLKWAKSKKYRMNGTTCDCAAAGGHINVLIWLRENGCKWSNHTCEEAIRHNHLDVLKWLVRNGCPLSRETATIAAEQNNLEALKYLRAIGCHFLSLFVCREAIWNGNLDMLIWLRNNGCTVMYGPASVAASRGHLHILEYLYDEHIFYDIQDGGNIHENCLNFIDTYGSDWKNEIWRGLNIKPAINK